MNDRFVSTKIMVNVPLKMRDGVELMCDVIRPDTADPLPTILVRTAYLKEHIYCGDRGPYLINAFEAAARGYNFVVQDARGTGFSGGVCDPSGRQSEDGYDTVEAIARMPWSNGDVGMVGESFLGYACLEAARMNPPHLKCIVPCEAGWLKNPYFHRYGVPTVGSHGWCYGRAMDRDTRFHEMTQETRNRIRWVQEHEAELLLHLPLCDMPQDQVPGVPGLDKYRELLEHIGDDRYLAEIGRDDAFEQIHVPVMHVTGWLDPEMNTTLYNFCNFRVRGGSAATRDNMKLIVGPWPHSASLPGQYGGKNFGPQGSGAGYGVDEKIFAFLDQWMKGITSPFMTGDPVHVFVMGQNAWKTFSSWPPEQARAVPYYLHSDGHANTMHGDGTLTEAPRGAETPDSYIYDPGDPIPTLPRHGESSRFADQSPIEERTDMLVYTTPAFPEARTIMGMVQFHFYAASSAKDTDFAGRLLLVHPDGKAVEINASLLRARYRNGRTPEWLTPGAPTAFHLDLTNVCLTVPKGYALRLEVSSCLFPLADRNLNTGGKIGFETRWIVAQQTLFHDTEHPSRLILPMMPTTEKEA